MIKVFESTLDAEMYHTKTMGVEMSISHSTDDRTEFACRRSLVQSKKKSRSAESIVDNIDCPNKYVLKSAAAALFLKGAEKEVKLHFNLQIFQGFHIRGILFDLSVGSTETKN